MSAHDTRPSGADGPTDVLDPARFVRRNRAWLVAGALLGAALAIAVSFAVTPRWEAEVVMRLGTRLEWEAGFPQDAVVEEPALAIERIGQAAFQQDVLSRLGTPAGEHEARARILRDGVRARPQHVRDRISIRVRAPTRAEAEAIATGIAAALAAAHARIASPPLERLRAHLDTLQEDLRRAEDARAGLLQASGSPVTGRAARTTAGARRTGGAADARRAQDLVVANALAARDATIAALREHLFALREALSPDRSYPSAPLAPARVGERPAWPQRPLFALAGAVMGLVIAAVAAALARRG